MQEQSLSLMLGILGCFTEHFCKDPSHFFLFSSGFKYLKYYTYPVTTSHISTKQKLTSTVVNIGDFRGDNKELFFIYFLFILYTACFLKLYFIDMSEGMVYNDYIFRHLKYSFLYCTFSDSGNLINLSL